MTIHKYCGICCIEFCHALLFTKHHDVIMFTGGVSFVTIQWIMHYWSNGGSISYCRFNHTCTNVIMVFIVIDITVIIIITIIVISYVLISISSSLPFASVLYIWEFSLLPLSLPLQFCLINAVNVNIIIIIYSYYCHLSYQSLTYSSDLCNQSMKSFSGMCMHEIKTTYVRHQSISNPFNHNTHL